MNARKERAPPSPVGSEEKQSDVGLQQRRPKQQQASMHVATPFVGTTRRNTMIGGHSLQSPGKSLSSRELRARPGSLRPGSSPNSPVTMDYWGVPKSRSTGPSYVLEQLSPKLWLRVHRSGRCEAVTSPTARTCIPLDYVSNAEYEWQLTHNGGLRR